jgi:phytoene dehydrogenase-like protein
MRARMVSPPPSPWRERAARSEFSSRRAAWGGGTRSAPLTLPGFVQDVCSAIHPLAAGSPFFRSLSLDAHELELVHAPHPLAHPLDNGTAVLLKRSVGATAADLGQDAGPYRALMAPLVRDWPILAEPILAPPRVPRRPLALARFGVVAL